MRQLKIVCLFCLLGFLFAALAGSACSGSGLSGDAETGGTDKSTTSVVVDSNTADSSTGTDSDSATNSVTDGDSGSDIGTGSDSETGSDTGSNSADEDWLTWIAFPPGTFRQGNEDPNSLYVDETPAHRVTIHRPFALMKHEVTVAEFRRCVDAGECKVPYDKDPLCNYFLENREDHPVNCVDFSQAEAFCAFAGGRLPSESEWEYAARSAGKDHTFPWGEEEPSCDLAVMDDVDHNPGCGTGGTMPVCSKPAGNTEHGLCDMAGNVYEWLPDGFRVGYVGAPKNGSVWEPVSETSSRVVRGGYYGAATGIPSMLRTRARFYLVPWSWGPEFGFRCAKTLG